MTERDKEFLEKLRALMASKELSVELRRDNPSYMVLRGTYGERIHRIFRMTRQGVRWRFHHIFNRAYVAAFETILAIETAFGTHLREHAIRISKERYALRREALRNNFESASRLARREGADGTRPGKGAE